MLIYRLHHEEKGIIMGRSRCPQCEQKLAWWNLLPVFSWVFQGGKCAYCKKSIPVMYPLIEFSYAVLFFVFAHKFYSIEFWWMLPLVFFLLVLFFYDLWFMEVDDRIAIPAILMMAGVSFFREIPVQDLWLGGALGFSFYALQYFGSKGRWVGAGDMRLGLLLGLIFGWAQLILVLFLSYIIGTVVALFLIATKGYGPKSALPMGAFLMPAALIFLYSGEVLWDWYLNYLGF